MTRKTRSYRPSPALVISCVALFLALTGSALAVGLAKNSVRSAQIVDGTVRTVDLRDASVTAPKLAPDSVGSEAIAEHAIGASEIQPHSVGASELGTVTVRTNSTTVAKNGDGSVSVNCASGEQLLSGGGQPGHFGTEMTSSRPSGNGWLYQAKNNGGSEDTLTVFALCLAG